MSRATLHRLTVIFIILVLFAMPFYATRQNIREWGDPAYLAAAAVYATNIPSSEIPTPVRPGGLGIAVGNSFVFVTARPMAVHP